MDHRLAIDKLVFGGQGLGRINGKAAFVWNALPGETVDAHVIANKKTHLEAVATRIHTPSPDRIQPKEDHFLSCSAWQILSEAKELEWKRRIAEETYAKLGGFSLSVPIDIAYAGVAEGYRNKMEYSFAETTDANISFAFFERGGRMRRPLDRCIFADSRITAAADHILRWVNEKRIPIRSLKTLVVRSNAAGAVIAGLFLKDRLSFPDLPALDHGLVGIQLYYSTHQSPASVPTAPLAGLGSMTLAETVNGASFAYGLFSFFQINVPIFETALRDMQKHSTPGVPILDYYTGVGVIGMALGAPAGSILVDSNIEAVDFAEKNLATNAMRGVRAEASPAEKMTGYIDADHMLILDPPRAGLHQKVVAAILEKKPPRILYLSCNISTQARDLDLLSSKYHLSHISLYNFFPRTPHIEGLCVLERIA